MVKSEDGYSIIVVSMIKYNDYLYNNDVICWEDCCIPDF